MINVNELKVGSWIHSNLAKQDFQVSIDDFRKLSIEPQNFSPVLISESGLMKIGFIHDDDGYYCMPVDENYELVIFDDLSIGMRGFTSGDYVVLDIFVKDIHSVQNLISVLCNGQ